MGTALGNDTVFNHQDLIGISDRGKPVGYGYDGTAAGNSGDGFLDLMLGFYIDRRCGFIQNDDGRATQDRPGDGDPLLLPSGKS